MKGDRPFLPFNRPYVTGREFDHIREAISRAHLSGDGIFTRKCHDWLERRTGCAKALLTHSGTAALEMCALLARVEAGDEVIMPSFTFVSTANAFVLRGAVPVFIDIHPETLTIDERLVEAAVTPRTRAVVAVHYAGVACEMEELSTIAARRQLTLIEDAAQALGASYRGRPLGTFGLAATSFHETKNVISGEGGALLVNDPELVARAEILREKGTDRSRFVRGEVDKYTWIDVGSSFLPSELTAAFLWAQLEEADRLLARRLEIWNWYYQRTGKLERSGRIRRPIVPEYASHNAHMFYVLLNDRVRRDGAIAALAAEGVNAVFHYVPLHSSPAGRRYARVSGSMTHTDAAGDRLLRLPLWLGMEQADVERVVDTLERHLG